MSDGMDRKEDKRAVWNVGSEHESVRNECETENRNREETEFLFKVCYLTTMSVSRPYSRGSQNFICCAPLKNFMNFMPPFQKKCRFDIKFSYEHIFFYNSLCIIQLV
jgi:hypothetical protein